MSNSYSAYSVSLMLEHAKTIVESEDVTSYELTWLGSMLASAVTGSLRDPQPPEELVKARELLRYDEPEHRSIREVCRSLLSYLTQRMNSYDETEDWLLGAALEPVYSLRR